ncbi:brevican core protein-like [Anableps anableps]
MLLATTRHVQILPLICAVCHLTLAFPIQTPSAHDGVRQLQLNIPHSGPILTSLGSSISIPCLVSLSSTSSLSPSVVPRVKWTVVSGGVETQILVARSSRVKINEAYRDRAALLNYTSSPEDVSLWLGDLRHSDSGHYRCEVQQGLEDASKVVQVKVKGVVFHYRDALGRYSFSFQQAQRACEGIGAQVATPDQLLAAYFDGYEQCDAGWLADQSVRYPIQVPREGCYGDMDGQPGVRNYGTMNPDDLFDVYCYIEQIHGKVFYDPVPQHISFDEAQSYCQAAGAQLATTAQLYSAWSEGLDRCSPGWLSDGSVRYPIVIPRERCGGPQAGVKTLYRFSNQTGFPDPSTLHDVYCFKVSETSMSTKSMSTRPTMTTPTHMPKRTWSPRTTRPHIFHETTEPQKVNHFMPPLDHGVVDLEISLTPPPTLLNLPKERAAVGGTGAFSDACLDDPCLNGGTCTERDGHIKCLCLPTYGGQFCQTDLERCEPGWDKFHGFCYRHFSQRQSWEVAERHCRTQGAHLVSIMTPEEQDYINSNYKEYQWTGLNDKTVEDDFRWSDGNLLLYENWYRGQPDSYFLSGEDCVVMVWHDNGRWSDVPCNYHLAYTCKKGTSSCGPPPKVRNASIFGKARVRYETNAIVRYHCSEGFQQRLNPLVRCLSGGRWERPQILCIREAGEIMQSLGMLSQTDSNFSAAENEFEATEETPQYWDIKF